MIFEIRAIIPIKAETLGEAVSQLKQQYPNTYILEYTPVEMYKCDQKESCEDCVYCYHAEEHTKDLGCTNGGCYECRCKKVT